MEKREINVFATVCQLLSCIATAVLVTATVAGSWYLMQQFLKYRNRPVEPPNQVNIISWWGYLGDKKMQAHLENQCHAKISLTEYLNVEDFSALIQGSPYDIYIYFPGDRYGEVQTVTNPGPDISAVAVDYDPNIQDHYYQAELS